MAGPEGLKINAVLLTCICIIVIKFKINFKLTVIFSINLLKISRRIFKGFLVSTKNPCNFEYYYCLMVHSQIIPLKRKFIAIMIRYITAWNNNF